MKNIAFVFPGQGSQSVGAGKDLFENYESAAEIFRKADEACGYDVSKVCFEGPVEDLNRTIYTQPAIMSVSLACLKVFEEISGITPGAVAGHSLGEYAALAAAGVLSEEDSFKLIAKRAYLTDAATKTTEGSMAAILGLSDEVVSEELSKLSKEGVVSAANFNCPGQVVITGEKPLVEKAMELMKARGAKRAIPLAVSGAFHSELMKGAALEFEVFAKDFDFSDAKIPVFENVDGKPIVSGKELKSRLTKQIYSSVMWTKTIENMIKSGIDTFIEVGPGKVLSGLNRKISKEIKIYNVSDVESIKSVTNEIGQGALL